MQTSRTSTVGMRRIKSHEPGQRVMTEAIAFLFTYYSSDAPIPEEFFAYARGLCIQTYHLMCPGPRRRISSRLLGGTTKERSDDATTNSAFYDSIEPLQSDSLLHRLIQAQNIALRALITYTAFVDDDSEKTVKTHIAEPFIWFSAQLFHDSLKYRENCIGAALHYIQDGVVSVVKSASGRRLKLSAYFEAYNAYMKSNADIFGKLQKYLVARGL